MKVILPWPPKELSPNKRLHWAARAKHTKAYRTACEVFTRKAIWSWRPQDPFKTIITFQPPDNRRRDRDNMVSSFKAGQDGVCDCIGIDDAFWGAKYAFAEPKKPGAVIVEFIVENAK